MTMPRPKTEYLNNCKVANSITNNDAFSQTLKLTTIPKKSICVVIDLEASETLTVSNRNITQYDMAIMDAVYTLLVNGTMTFTPEMIARIMSGNFDQDVTTQKSITIAKHIRKLSLIWISIDCTDELRARKKIAVGETAQYGSYLLPIREIDIQSANHQTIMHGYQLIETPVLYRYAETIKQIVNIPTELLKISGTDGSRQLSDTDTVIVIKRALIRRIEAMKNVHNHINNNTIRYERYDSDEDRVKGFFADIGYKSDDKSSVQWRKKRGSLHAIITTILDDFVREKYIAGYEVIREARQKIVGVKITC